MDQERLKNIAILNVNNDITININDIAEEFIKRSAVRQNTFALKL